MVTVPMFAGDTKVLTIQVLDAADAQVDITGATSVRFQVDGPYPGEPLIQKSLDAGVEITEPQIGIFKVTLDPSDTEGMAGFMSFEAEVIVPDVVSTVIQGHLDIERTRIE